MHWWQIFLLAILGVVILPYIIGPLLVRSKVWFSANPEIQPQTEADLPRQVEQFFTEASKRFEKIGFTEHWGDFRVTRFFSTDQEHFIRAVVNPETRESAGAVYVIQPVAHAEDIFSKLYGFSSELDDHREIATGNSTHPSMPIRSELYQEIVLPDIWDMEQLYKIHRFSTQKAVGNQTLWLPDFENAIEAMRHTFLKPAKALEQAAVVKLDQQKERYVFTWSGAFLMTWQELWPFKWLRLRRLKKLAVALIEAAG